MTIIKIRILKIILDTPLHLAASYGKLQVFKLLLPNVIEKNPANIHGYTPLHHAALNSNLEMYELIIGQIQDKNPTNDRGKTPRDYLQSHVLKKVHDLNEATNVSHYVKVQTRENNF